MKKISQSLLVAAVVAAAGASASAEVLSPEEALSRALPKARLAAPGLAQPVLAYTAEADELPAVYVFAKENKGFILVAADDAVTPVLGYADRGNFTAENMAPGLKYWIGEYARQIAYARENGFVSNENEVSLSRAAGRTPIEPLVKTTWNQGAPYNNFCPDGCPTGCVATAAAQVINFHKFPTAELKGEIAYTAGVNGVPTPLSVDLNGFKFDWDNMLNDYPRATSGTQAQRDAVAKLMQVIGYGVEMNYASSASGAQTQLVRNLVVEKFGYDPSILYLSRECYTLADWEELLYNELAANRPVLYDGSTINNEGHAFVCDGYMEQDGVPYFHINWGWGGMSDGYFLIDTLDPEAQGAGGASSGAGFDYGQNATVNFMPNQGGAWQPQITANGTGLSLTSSFNMGNEVTVSYTGGAFFNYSYTKIPEGMAYGLRVVGEGQNFCRFAAATTSELESMRGAASYNVLLSGIKPNSTYVVSPVFKLANSNEIYDIAMPYGAVRQYVIKTGTYNATATPVGAGLVVSDVTITEQINVNRYGTMSVKFSNDGEFYYYGHLAPVFLEKQYGEYSIKSMLTNFTLNLNPGESQEWSNRTIFTPTGTGLTNGNDYYFGVYNVDTKAIVGPVAKFHFGAVSGIEDVTINEDATPEYFNLQGIRVAEPQAGQVYIVRRGAQVVKELVK